METSNPIEKEVNMKCTIILHSNLRYYEMIVHGTEFLSYIAQCIRDEVICL